MDTTVTARSPTSRRRSGQFTDSDDTDTRYDHVTYTAERTNDHVAYTLTNAPMGTGNIVEAAITVNGDPVQTQQAVEFQVSAGRVDETTTTSTARPSSRTTASTCLPWAAARSLRSPASGCRSRPTRSSSTRS